MSKVSSAPSQNTENLVSNLKKLALPDNEESELPEVVHVIESSEESFVYSENTHVSVDKSVKEKLSVPKPQVRGVL